MPGAGARQAEGGASAGPEAGMRVGSSKNTQGRSSGRQATGENGQGQGCGRAREDSGFQSRCRGAPRTAPGPVRSNSRSGC